MTNLQDTISRKAAQHLTAAEAASDPLLRQAHRIAAERCLRQLGSDGRESPPDPEAAKARSVANAYAAVLRRGCTEFGPGRRGFAAGGAAGPLGSSTRSRIPNE